MANVIGIRDINAMNVDTFLKIRNVKKTAWIINYGIIMFTITRH